MKTVSGTVVASKPVSLSKAARILSKFASSDNGASPAFCAYLKRTSDSFNELVQLHKELKGSSANRRVKHYHPIGIVAKETVNSVKKPTEDSLPTEEKQGNSDQNNHLGSKRSEEEKVGEIEDSLIDDEMKRYKNNNRIDEGEGRKNTESASMMMDFQKIREKKNKHHKKEILNSGVKGAEQRDLSDGGVDEVRTANSTVQTEGGKGNKHERKRRNQVEERDGGANKIESRKRKHTGVGDGGVDDSEQQYRSSKKKKRKSEVDN